MHGNGNSNRFLISIRSSLWFVPGLITLGSILLAIALLEVDRYFADQLRDWSPRLFETEGDGAQGMLSAIATSMATVAGVVFSITVVALTLASTQYTSRVLRNFMRDRVTQAMLGIFIGVYLYCLLVLRTISGGEWAFKPSASVLGGVILAILATGFFIFFIHHISSSIQASEICASITRETAKSLKRLFPEKIGAGAPQITSYALADKLSWQAVPVAAMGYVQTVDDDALLAFAKKHRCIVRMECGIGDFVTPGRPLVSLNIPFESNPTRKAEIVKTFNSMYAVGATRTIEQDAAFGIRQLVDIALKALSPSINDTTTAVTCIQHISYLLALSAQRHIPGPYRFTEHTLRVIAVGPNFQDFMSLAFDQIAETASDNTEIVIQLLNALEQIAETAQTPMHFAVIKQKEEMCAALCAQHIPSAYAQERVQARFQALREHLHARQGKGAAEYPVFYPEDADEDAADR